MILPSRLRHKIERCPFYGCWLWTGAKNDNGYGRVRAGSDRRVWLVHRLFYIMFVGDIKDGMDIDHTCTTRNCCNPRHLRQLSHIDNMKEMHHRRSSKNEKQTALFFESGQFNSSGAANVHQKEKRDSGAKCPP